MSDVIDFRARANTPENRRYLLPRQRDIAAMGIRALGRDEWYEAPEESVEEFVGQLDDAGVARTVFVGRNRSSDPEWAMTNDWVAGVVDAHPDRIIGFAGVDATNLDAAADEIERAVRSLGLVGANIDPYQIDARPDDPVFDPVYDTCTRLGVPVIVTLGGLPGIAAHLTSGPLALDRVAARFPDLVIVACHGGWPFVNEMIAVAWRRPNVYFDNSFYHFAPGAEVLVEAANTMVGDKMLYASAYPFVPLKETLERFRRLPFDDDVAERVLHGNAERILGLTSASSVGRTWTDRP